MAAVSPTLSFLTILYFNGIKKGLRLGALGFASYIFLNKATNSAKERSYTIPFPFSRFFTLESLAVLIGYLPALTVSVALNNGLFEPTQNILLQKSYNRFKPKENQPPQTTAQKANPYLLSAASATTIKAMLYFLHFFSMQKICSSYKWPLLQSSFIWHLQAVFSSALEEYCLAYNREKIPKLSNKLRATSDKVENQDLAKLVGESAAPVEEVLSQLEKVQQAYTHYLPSNKNLSNQVDQLISFNNKVALLQHVVPYFPYLFQKNPSEKSLA